MNPAPAAAAAPSRSNVIVSDDDATRRLSLVRYRRRAAAYDSTCGPTWPVRERTVAALHLQPGQRVLDIACGTGLSLGMLREGVGDSGHVYGIDHSPEMLEQARRRVDAEGWRNVTLFSTAAQDVALPEPVDALLFHFTHDILRSPTAIDRLLACARPGAQVAIAGVKYFPSWLAPLNLWVYLKNRAYNGAPGELRTPWDRIAPRLVDWHFTPVLTGMGYVAGGRLAPPAAGPR